MLLASLTACGRSGGLGPQEEQASGLALEAGAPSHMPAREPQRAQPRCASCPFSSRFLVTPSFGAGLELYFLSKSSPHPVRGASFPFYR